MSKAKNTRLTILQKGFELIYSKGYRTTSIDEIIAMTNVTKGAFYYHFKSKEEMGLAIIEELLKDEMYKGYIKPLENSKEPTEGILSMIRKLLFENDRLTFQYGCPAGNLAREMTPWNEKFREALAQLTTGWKQAIAKCIEAGKQNGYYREDSNSEQVAVFIMSGYWGIRTFGKIYNGREFYDSYLNELEAYLEGLR